MEIFILITLATVLALASFCVISRSKMSLYGSLVDEIQKLFDTDDVKKDNVVNKLYYKVTALTLAGASLVLSLHQVCIFVPL